MIAARTASRRLAGTGSRLRGLEVGVGVELPQRRHVLGHVPGLRATSTCRLVPQHAPTSAPHVGARRQRRASVPGDKDEHPCALFRVLVLLTSQRLTGAGVAAACSHHTAAASALHTCRQHRTPAYTWVPPSALHTDAQADTLHIRQCRTQTGRNRRN
eukprot:1009789-Rhodomonas_salina.2